MSGHFCDSVSNVSFFIYHFIFSTHVFKMPVPLIQTWHQSFQVSLVCWSSRSLSRYQFAVPRCRYRRTHKFQMPCSSSHLPSSTFVASFMYFLLPCLSAKFSKYLWISGP